MDHIYICMNLITHTHLVPMDEAVLHFLCSVGVSQPRRDIFVVGGGRGSVGRGTGVGRAADLRRGGVIGRASCQGVRRALPVLVVRNAVAPSRGVAASSHDGRKRSHAALVMRALTVRGSCARFLVNLVISVHDRAKEVDRRWTGSGLEVGHFEVCPVVHADKCLLTACQRAHSRHLAFGPSA